MSKTFNRRQFLKFTATGGVAAAFATMYGLGAVQAAHQRAVPRSIPDRVAQTLAQSPAAAMPSALPLGAPLADIHKGWDGTLWAIDTNGVPHTFDQISQSWQVFGNGFDAIARYDALSFFVVRGAEVSIRAANPVPLTSVWQNLPDSFAQGIDGAANVKGVIYLFRNGRYVAIDPATQTASAPVAVTSFANWPATTDSWQHGAVDVVGSNGTTIEDTRVLLWCKGEFVFVDMLQKAVIDGPHPLTYYVAGQMLAGMQQGFKTMLWDESNYEVNVFNGPIQWHTVDRRGTATARYPSGYYEPWAPTLAHAPHGESGALWAAVTPASDRPVYHDGQDWQVGPMVDNGSLREVSVGVDGAIFGLTNVGLHNYNPATGAWTQIAPVTFDARQLAVGDAGRIWLRDGQNGVYRFGNGAFTALNLGYAATDIAAGSDGTLWHTAGDGNIYRYLAEGTQASTALPPGTPSGSVIGQVAATGFGSAYVLTSTAQLYHYRTPYIFKTSAVYFATTNYRMATQTITVAGQRVILAVANPTRQLKIGDVVALDAQTGAELWTFVIPALSGEGYSSSVHVFDAALNLLYVVGGRSIYALDVETGQQVWHLDAATSFQLGGSLQAPVLYGNLLCIGHNSGNVVAVDTAAALAAARNQQLPQPLWATQTQANPELGVQMGVPTIDGNGVLYVSTVVPADEHRNVTALRVTDGKILWQKALDAQFGDNLPLDIIVGSIQASDGKTTTPALLVNAINAVLALDPANGNTLRTYAVPQPTDGPGALITSGMNYLQNQLYFGDSLGKFYVVNALTMQLVRMVETPQASYPYGVSSRPMLIAGEDANAGVVACFVRGDLNIYFLDPATGNLAQLATDQTAPAVLTYDHVHGVLYAMGWNYGPGGNQLGQFFALRPDSYIQDERSFIIESELMQDFADDNEAAAQGASRYQTHVTIVDANKAGRANQSVKLWADEENTTVRIDGTAYTIGPDTPAYFTSDGTGSFTIVSDAGDLAAVTLRLWAAFMDEHERIAVVPDAEFHRRLAATTATGSTDPQQIDLASAKSYDGGPLFSDAGQAQQAASAVTQLTSSVGLGGGPALVHSSGLRTHTSQSRYITYPQHIGLAYTPVDVAANRGINAQLALGLSVDAQGHTVLTTAQAANLFDQMEGVPHELLGGFLSSLKSAWHEIKQAAGQVVQVVVSVAKDVLAGIQYVVNGVTKVVKAVVQDIKDATAAIGAFFVQLGKDIVKVVQALSKFLWLDKVFATAKIIRDQLNGALGIMSPMLSAGKAALDDWFTGAETDVANKFCNLYDSLGLPGCSTGGGGGKPINGMDGIGATPTTIYNQGLSGNASQAVECGWSSHVLRNNLDQVTPAGLNAGSENDSATALEGLISGFLNDMKNNQQLSAAYKSVRQSFSATLQAASPEEFFQMALRDLLEIFKTLAITGLAIGKALCDTLLGSIGTLVQGLQNLGTLRIPVLSTLWRAFFGSDLTFLELIAFVLAFPVTFIYRAVDGNYPVDSASVSASAVAASTVKNVMGLVGSLALLFAGVLTAVFDSVTVINKTFGVNAAVRTGWKIFGLFLLAVNTGQGIYAAAVRPDHDRSVIALATTSTLGLLLAIGGQSDPEGLATANTIIGIFNVIFFTTKYFALNDVPLTLSREVVGAVPVIVNPVKFSGLPAGLIAPAVDVLCRWASGGIQMAQTIEGWNSLGGDDPVWEWKHRLHMPLITQQ